MSTPPQGPFDPSQGQPRPGQQYPQHPQPSPNPYGPPGYQGPPPPQQPGPPLGHAGPPPGQPGYAGPSGGQPPQGPYSWPGGQGQPGGGGNKRRNLVIGGAAGGVVLLVAVVGAVVIVSNSGPYASLPDCDEVFPEEVFEPLADDGDAEVEGEFERGEEIGELGSLSCRVGFAEDDERRLRILVEILEPESTAFEDMYTEFEDEYENLENQRPPREVGELESTDGYTSEQGVWEPIRAGDIGASIAVADAEGLGNAGSLFIDRNAAVIVDYTFPHHELTWDEALDEVALLSREVERRISGAAERL